MPSPPDVRPLDPVAAVPAHELVLAQLRRSIHLGHFGAGDSCRRSASWRGSSACRGRRCARRCGCWRARASSRSSRGSSGGIVLLDQPVRPGGAAARRASSRTSSSSASPSSRWRRASPPSGARTPTRALDEAFEGLEARPQRRRGRSRRLGPRRRRYHLLVAPDRPQPAARQRAIEEAARACSCPIGAVCGRLERAPTTGTTEFTTAIVAGDAEPRAARRWPRTSSTRAPTCARCWAPVRPRSTRRTRRPRARSTRAARG